MGGGDGRVITMNYCGLSESEVSAVRPTPVPWTAPGRTDKLARSGEIELTFAGLTTLGVGGKVAQLVKATSETEIIAAVRSADAADTAVLMLGGGSNLVPQDGEFAGVVVLDMRRGITLIEDTACGGATVVVPGGHPWDDFVCEAISRGWAGPEALSGIPGCVGAAPVQNIGAYGAEVAEFISQVIVWDRAENRRRTLVRSELKLGYRSSILKDSMTDPVAGGGRTWGPTGRYIVLEVVFQMAHATRSEPVRYTQLADALGVQVGERVSSIKLREAVLQLRRSKGMVVDGADPDSRSAGSFFTNPILPLSGADSLPEGAPRFPVEKRALANPVTGQSPLAPNLVKTSAAYLISAAEITRGFALENSGAAVSSKHVLALTNRGGATAEEVRILAKYVANRVHERFGIALHPEPVYL